MTQPLVGTTIDMGDVAQNLLDRVKALEQKITSPNYTVPNGSDPAFGTVLIGDSGVPLSDGVSPPTGLAGTSGAVGGEVYLHLTWTAPADNTASSYLVVLASKDQASGLYTLNNQVAVVSPEAYIYDVQPNSVYGVRVFSVNAIGVPSSLPLPATGWYDISSGADTTIPAGVTGLAGASGQTSVTVFWNANTEVDVANGAGGYELQYTTDASFITGIVDSYLSATIASITGLDSTKMYHFRVRAKDSSGNPGPWSATLNIQPGVPGVAAAGSDGVAPASSPTPTVSGLIGPCLLIKFTMISNLDPVIYEIHLSTVNNFTPSSATKVATSGSSNVILFNDVSGAALVYGTTYYVKIIATDPDGAAAASAQGSAAPSATGAVTSSSLSDGHAPTISPTPTLVAGVGALMVQWGAISNADPVTYDIHISTTNGFTPSGATLVASSPATNVMLLKDAAGSTLAYGTTYYVKIVARDSDGSAAVSSQASGATRQASPSDIVSNSITVASGLIASLDASKITTGTMSAGFLGVGTLTAASGVIASLDASKISTGSMSAAFIGVNTLTSDRIVTTGLDASVIKFNSMDGQRITAGTLDVGTLKATGTISAKTFTLASTGQFIGGTNPTGSGSAQSGWILNGNGFTAYNAGVMTFNIDINGNAYFKGNLTGATGTFSGALSGNTISGTLINGGVLQGGTIITAAAAPFIGISPVTTGYGTLGANMYAGGVQFIGDGVTFNRPARIVTAQYNDNAGSTVEAMALVGGRKTSSDSTMESYIVVYPRDTADEGSTHFGTATTGVMFQLPATSATSANYLQFWGRGTSAVMISNPGYAALAMANVSGALGFTGVGVMTYDGSTYVNLKCASAVQTSDRNLKTGFQEPSHSSLNLLRKADVLDFTYKRNHFHNEQRHFGIMAQDLPDKYQIVEPRKWDEPDRGIGTDLGTMIGIAHHAIKELDAEVQELRKEIKLLRKAAA